MIGEKNKKKALTPVFSLGETSSVPGLDACLVSFSSTPYFLSFKSPIVDTIAQVLEAA